MRIRPVRARRKPTYPTQSILDQHPELLRLIPKRWQRSKLVLAGLSMAVGLVLGCRHAAPPTTARAVPVASPATPPVSSMVAPLFLHGDGWAAYGGLSMDRAAVLTEPDARAIIAQECAKAGLDFENDTVTLPGVPDPLIRQQMIVAALGKESAPLIETVTEETGADGSTITVVWTGELLEPVEELLRARLYDPEASSDPPNGDVDRLVDELLRRGVPDDYEESSYFLAATPNAPVEMVDFPGGTWPAVVKDLELDGTDRQAGVSYEYLSQADYGDTWHGRQWMGSTYRAFDLIGTATALRTQLATQHHEDRLAVFYDPCVSTDEVGGDFLEDAPEAIPLAKEHLRAQVRDFIEWLKAEGVI